MSDKEIHYTEGDVDRFVIVVKPNAKQQGEAARIASKTFAALVNDKDENGNHVTILRTQLDNYMRANNLWDDTKEKQLKKLVDNIAKNERQLAKGGIGLSEAKELAIQIRKDRVEQTILLAKQRELDEFTVEGQIENIRFDYLVSVCVLDENRQPLFKDIDDYHNNGDKKYVVEAVSELANLLYGLDPKWEEKLPENKFLKQYGFVNDNLSLVNKDNHLVDIDGNLIDEQGRRVNENGDFIDVDGNLVDEDGRPIEEFSPFLDDDGNPIVIESE